MNRKLLVCSVSGGRTSAFMALAVKAFWESRYEKVIYVFANTGEEHPETLDFVHRFEVAFNIPLVWVEASVNMTPRIGTSFRIVNHATATRSNALGGPFEQVIRKYEIPNSGRPGCSRELKRYPILAYTRYLGFKRNQVDMAVGIRADEIDRISENAEAEGMVYPLIRPGITKQRVLDFWRQYPDIDLKLPEHWGNCMWCWKKSDRKLFTVAKEKPEAFAFAARMERNYGMVGKEKVKGPDGKGQRFFRGSRYVSDIMAGASQLTNPFVDQRYLDLSNGCEDSCEVDFK